MATPSSLFDKLPNELILRCLVTPTSFGIIRTVHGPSFQNLVEAYPALQDPLYDASTEIEGISYDDTSTRAMKRLPRIVSESQNIKALDISYTRLKSLDGLVSHSQIVRLDISGTNVKCLSPIGHLAGLKHLDIHYTHVKDLHVLKSMSLLEYLDCSCTRVYCVDVLRHAPNLEYLNCSRTRVCYLDCLENSVKLKHINISRTHVNTLQPLMNALKSRVETLNCSRTCLMSSDLMYLQHAVNLRWLNFGFTYVDDMGFLSKCPLLEHLECQRTLVSELGSLKNAKNLSYLDCSNTHVVSIFPLIENLVLAHIFPFRRDVGPCSPRLEYLDCSWNDKLQEGTLWYVYYMNDLSHLDISGLKISMHEYMAVERVPKVIAREVELGGQ